MSQIDAPQVDRKVYTISELNRRAKSVLELHLPMVWVSGEISNFSKPSSGHWYLSLKDENAQVRCAMFRNRNQYIKFQPQAGDHVQVRARVSLFEGRGEYQLIIEHMEEAGFGLLQKRFEELKNKLQAEGLFDAENKRPLPAMPKHIAIITSPTGAAIRDALSVLARRFKPVDVTIFPSPVQGESAPKQLIAALEQANAFQTEDKAPIDVILLCRGGGSIEDLWAFNSEALARKIAESAIPTICGVGHEVDVSIADWVADVRAATPSAAAELIVPDAKVLSSLFNEWSQRLCRTTLGQLRQHREKLDGQRARLKHPLERIEFYAQSLDQIESRLQQAQGSLLGSLSNTSQSLLLRLRHQHPEKTLGQLQEKLTHTSNKLVNLIKDKLAQGRFKLQTGSSVLNAVSPLATLNRGYAIASKADGSVLYDADQTSQGESVTVRLAKGTLLTQVQSTKK